MHVKTRKPAAVPSSIQCKSVYDFATQSCIFIVFCNIGLKSKVQTLQKKDFTSFDVAAIVRELKETAVNSRVSNIYQPKPETLLFKLHKPNNPDVQLVLEAGRRVHTTSYTTEKPSTPTAFCMALRKYIRNGWLTSVEQHEFDRVIIFSFKTNTDIVRLVVELFGDGNFILTDEKGMILQALSYKVMRDRSVLRGEPFAFAPSSGQNPLKINIEEFRECLKSFGDTEIVRAIARFLSVGGVYAEEILLRANVEKTKPCNTLSESEERSVMNSLEDMLSQLVSGKLDPYIVKDESGTFVDAVPLRLQRYECFVLQPYGSFAEALDEFYAHIMIAEKAESEGEIDGLKREAERLKRMIENQKATLLEAEAKAGSQRLIGDAIYTHGGELQILLDKFLAAKEEGRQWKEVLSEVLTEKSEGLKPSTLFESFDAKNLTINVRINNMIFGLNLRRTLFENAADFYEHGKRAKQKLEGTKKALSDSMKKLQETEAQIRMAEEGKQLKPAEAQEELAKRKIKHKEWFEKFRWFTSSDGFLIVAGKDAVSNEVLIKKHTDDNDIVFHADIIGAPFVVVKTENKKPSKQCILEAGEFAAAYSRAWREGFGSVDVYWVKPEQLSKGGPSGESVGHGAFVVRGERNWSRGVRLKLAIGVVLDENSEIAILGGPVDAVKAKTELFVEIGSGDLEGKELFKKVLNVLAGRASKETREKILKVSIEEIREFVPFSKGRISEN